ncbi:MAG: cytochrome b [Polaromonas sp.]|uniref:cytochrome b n=1 Tax=Polaromonas sp. TaxID=1869339 RepID=UPI0025F49355|nr:cytochrome b [Polaromonas sp.]MBI2725059.1 cytochrome b [Polaromonas sp.]
MNLRNTTARYGLPAVILHWLMLLLLVAVYACMELSDNFPKGSDMRAALKTWHYMLGLTVFVLVWIRLAVKLTGETPAIEPPPPVWQQRLSQLVQLALYALMIGLPLAGWFLLSAKGQVIPFFGLQLPALIAENRNAAGWIKEVHEIGATAGYFLVGLHAVASLYHHYFLRDNTLRRMLPGSKSPHHP